MPWPCRQAASQRYNLPLLAKNCSRTSGFRWMTRSRVKTCHDPAKGFTDHRGNSATSAGVQDQHGQRNAPSVLNAMFQASQFWDGRAATLEDQAKLPVLNPVEMGQKSPNDVAAKIARIPNIQTRSNRFWGTNRHTMISRRRSRPSSGPNFPPIRRLIASWPGTLRRSASRPSVAGHCFKARGAAVPATRSTRCRRFSPTRNFTTLGSPRISEDFAVLARKALKHLTSGNTKQIDDSPCRHPILSSAGSW